jgi:hypothetical protein
MCKASWRGGGGRDNSPQKDSGESCLPPAVAFPPRNVNESGAAAPASSAMAAWPTVRPEAQTVDGDPEHPIGVPVLDRARRNVGSGGDVGHECSEAGVPFTRRGCVRRPCRPGTRAVNAVFPLPPVCMHDGLDGTGGRRLDAPGRRRAHC